MSRFGTDLEVRRLACPRTFACALALVAGVTAAACRGETATHLPVAAPAPPTPVNVLLLSVDTLRADRLSSYGAARQTTPAIDLLATQGVSFDSAFAPRGLTWPSLTSLSTSRYPGSHGVRDNGVWRDSEDVTLAGVLAANGWKTAAFLTNMQNAPHRGFGQVEGFKVDEQSPNDLPATRAALEWLERHHQERFFLWLHLLAPHAPYTPPAPFDRVFADPDEGGIDGNLQRLTALTTSGAAVTPTQLKQVVALYDGEVAFVDSLIGLVLRKLAALGLDNETLVVFTGDHGEELYEHNGYFFHKLSIYDSVLRVPLVFRLPAHLPAEARFGEIVETLDIAPTILDVVGLARPAEFQGKSLQPLMRGESLVPERQVAFAEIGPGIGSVRTARWRYVANPQQVWLPIFDGDLSDYRYAIAPEELYDMASPEREQLNVVEQFPQVAADLRRRLRAWRRATELVAGGTRREDPEMLRQLRALGYVN